MKIMAETIKQFQKVEEILRLVDDDDFMKSFEFVELQFDVLNCHAKYYFDKKIFLPKNINILSIKMEESITIEKADEDFNEIKKYNITILGTLIENEIHKVCYRYNNLSSSNIEITKKHE